MTTTSSRERSSGSARLTVDIPRDIHRRLRIRAAETETTMTALVVALLASMLPDGNADHTDRR